jgi:hypothetical protein
MPRERARCCRVGMPKFQRNQWLLAAVFCLAFAPLADASELDSNRALNPSLQNGWQIRGGAVYNTADATVGSTIRSTGQGGKVDLSQLGVDDDYVSPTLLVRWRTNRRLRFDFAYENLYISGHRSASTTIEFDDITIPVGWDVRSNLKVEMYAARAGYAVYTSPNSELGIMLGVNVFDASARISGAVTVGATATASASIAETLPVPTIGLYGTYAVTDRLSIEGSASYIGGNYKGISGDVLILSAQANYWVTPRFALGIGYRHLDVDVKVKSSNRIEVYDFGFGGPQATLTYKF